MKINLNKIQSIVNNNFPNGFKTDLDFSIKENLSVYQLKVSNVSILIIEYFYYLVLSGDYIDNESSIQECDRILEYLDTLNNQMVNISENDFQDEEAQVQETFLKLFIQPVQLVVDLYKSQSKRIHKISQTNRSVSLFRINEKFSKLHNDLASSNELLLPYVHFYYDMLNVAFHDHQFLFVPPKFRKVGS